MFTADDSLGIFLLFGALGSLGLLEFVVCLGAGGGLVFPGTKSKMGRSLSMTLLRSARFCPSSKGIQVPSGDPSAREECVTPSVPAHLDTCHSLPVPFHACLSAPLSPRFLSWLACRSRQL